MPGVKQHQGAELMNGDSERVLFRRITSCDSDIHHIPDF